MTAKTICVEVMTKGTLFKDDYGDIWLFIRKDGALSGVYHCERQKDGFKSCFAGCAEFEITAIPDIIYFDLFN